MGLEYKIIESTRKVLDSVICDRCGKKIESNHDAHWNPCGTPHSHFFEPMFEEEFFVLDTKWGYFSNGKDMEHHQAVVCEACYDIIFKDVTVSVSEYSMWGWR